MDVFALIAQAYSSGQSADLINDLIKFFVAWFLVRKEIRRQFNKITDEMSGIRTIIADLSSNITNVEYSHQSRITALEGDVSAIKKRIIKED